MDGRVAPDVAVVGAGPAGLVAADVLSGCGLRVALFEAMPSVGRKFLMAGRGGLNLTHSEPPEAFLGRYGAAKAHLSPMIRAFPPEALRAYAAALGQETFVGSSGRVFPTAMKASPLLRALMRRLEGQGVALHLRHRWVGWDNGHLLFATPSGPLRVSARTTLFAMGGASWPRLGATGAWAPLFRAEGLGVAPFQPANAGLVVAWSHHMQPHFGKPIKTAALTALGQTMRGDIIVSAGGVEGGPVYPIANHMRAALHHDPQPAHVDLRPDVTVEAIAARLRKTRVKDSLSTRLKRALSLESHAIALMRETGPLPSDAESLARLIKAVPLTIVALQGLERAISSAGGLDWSELTSELEIRHCPGHFAAGEMVDWEAPTGGYLLQACFSMGHWAANAIAARLNG